MDARLQRIDVELKLTWLALLGTLLVAVAFFWEILPTLRTGFATHSIRATLESLTYLSFLCFLLYGNVLYLLSRIGYFKRLEAHEPATEEELRDFHTAAAPPVAFLIPSYKEEEWVIRQALLSAALQEYPERQVVLLIDDPPNPTNPTDLASLARARRLPEEIRSLLVAEQQKLDRAVRDYRTRETDGLLDLNAECLRLSEQYRHVAGWFERQTKLCPFNDHTDALFAEKILHARALIHHARARDLLELAYTIDTLPAWQAKARVHREYYRLSTLFSARLSSFERKRYRNLSHEPNKAMNLNSYIGAMGKCFRECRRKDGLYLEEAPDQAQAVPIQDAAYVVILDADSLVLPEYALRLIHVLETPGNERIAVIQTPYTAVPNAASSVERVAGASTDVQYFGSQGSTFYGATFWVGASALLRKAALNDIETIHDNQGHQIRKYVEDRTLIEDTDSTFDLLQKGWTLHNYPERLTFSATPPDFGSLLIQRGRWSNGGLLVLPKLVSYLVTRPLSLSKFKEASFRLYNLVSPAGVSTGFFLLLAWPYSIELNTWWFVLTGLPYYLLYSRDLRLAGFWRKWEVLRVFALNLLLVPVLLTGTLKSLRQVWSGAKSSFARTPKILERTQVPAGYILFEFAFLLWLSAAAAVDFWNHHWFNGAFALANAGVLCWAIEKFIGFGNCLTDLTCSWQSWRTRHRQNPMRLVLKLRH
jgi:cellulose synthase/poly-beta-1,6-N-acetylglucosamine synthase-like glycosyltransferase